MSQDREEVFRLESLKWMDQILPGHIEFDWKLCCLSLPKYVKLAPAVGKVPVEINAFAVAEKVENCLALAAILPPHAILDKSYGDDSVILYVTYFALFLPLCGNTRNHQDWQAAW